MTFVTLQTIVTLIHCFKYDMEANMEVILLVLVFPALIALLCWITEPRKVTK